MVKSMAFVFLLFLSIGAQAVSQLKVICDRDSEDVYLDGKFKSSCDKDEPVRILVTSGKHLLEVKRDTKDAKYRYKKSFKIGDGVQKIIEVDSKPIYSEYHYYKTAIDGNDKSLCKEYLKRFPKGKYIDIVKEKEFSLKAMDDFRYYFLYKKRYKNSRFLDKIIEHYKTNPLVYTVSYGKYLDVGEKKIVSINKDKKTLYIWSLDNIKNYKKIQFERDYCSSKSSLGLVGLYNGDKGAIVEINDGLLGLNLQTEKAKLIEKCSFYSDMAISKHLSKFALSDRMGVKIFDLATKKVLKKYYPQGKYYTSLEAVTVSNDGKSFYFGMYWKKHGGYGIYKIDLKNYRLYLLDKDPYINRQINDMVITPDDRYLICVLDDGHNYTDGVRQTDETILVYDLKEERVVRIVHQAGDVMLVALSPDGKYLATENRDGEIRYWELKSGILLKKYSTYSSANSLVFSHDGKYLLYGDDNNQIKVLYVGFYKLDSYKSDLLRKCKNGDLLSCNRYYIAGGKSKTAKAKLLKRLESFLNKNGLNMSLNGAKVYITDTKYKMKLAKNSNVLYDILSIVSKNNKTFVFIKSIFKRSNFTFNSPIRFIQSSKKILYSKRYPNVYKIGAQKGDSIVNFVLEFDNLIPKKGFFKIVENDGCNSCLNFKGIIYSIR